MNQEKIGKYICELRKKNNLTQTELSRLIPTNRTSISKWERGVNLPDIDSLLKLSQIFNVSINDILNGSKINTENRKELKHIVRNLYKKDKKNKPIIKILIIIVLLIAFSFFVFYFINTYKQTKIYKITASGENVQYVDGLFVYTKNKIYFNMGNPITTEKIKHIKLYYVDVNNKKNYIYERDDYNIFIEDYYGYDEYFDTKNISQILNNLYIEVQLENSEELIKVNFSQDYINNNLFFKKSKSITNDVTIEKQNYINLDYIEQLIANKFTKQDNNYIYENENENYVYFTDDGYLIYSTINNNTIAENISYDFKTKSLTYNNYETSVNFSYTNNKLSCLQGSCDNYEVIIENFFVNLNNLLN